VIPATSRSHRKAVSLAEAVITMFLVAIVFGATAEMIGEAHRVIRFQSYKTASQQGAQLALQRMVSESREAVNITAVGPGTLELVKVDPSVPRFVDPAPSSWNPLSNFLTVRYFLSGDRLMRRVTVASSGTTATQVLGESVSGLMTALLPNGNLDITLSFQEEKKVQTWRTQVKVPSL